jgi:glycosyltransferase
MKTLAILLAYHNRRELTIRCLQSLYNAEFSDIAFQIYACDDGSTDGTTEAIHRKFPEIRIIPGSGSLFWNRGMLKVWEEALKLDYDYYLWLNDDTIVKPDFWEIIFSFYLSVQTASVISGLLQDIDTSEIIYGGTDCKGQRVKPGEPIARLNGNMVLIPREVVNVVGLLDPYFHHDLGDVDYGFRVIKAGFPILAAPQIMGYTRGNFYCRCRKWDVGVFERFRQLYSPHGANPRMLFYFKRKHFGMLSAVSTFLYLHVLNFFPDWTIRLISFFKQNIVRRLW